MLEGFFKKNLQGFALAVLSVHITYKQECLINDCGICLVFSGSAVFAFNTVLYSLHMSVETMQMTTN